MHRAERVIREQDLLDQLGWVRGLARRLLEDDHAAADLAQEAWLKAREAGAGTWRSIPLLRAWLARVTRTLARDSKRAGARRAEREHRAAREERLDSTYEVVERSAVQQTIARAVMELDEPYRSTILYRYLDGLTAVQVSGVMRTSPATVRKRLSRGVERLRARLDGEFGGSTNGWAIAILGPIHLGDIGLAGSTAAPQGAAASITAGVATMGLKAKTAVGAIAFSGAFVVWQATDDPLAPVDRTALELEARAADLSSPKGATELVAPARDRGAAPIASAAAGESRAGLAAVVQALDQVEEDQLLDAVFDISSHPGDMPPDSCGKCHSTGASVPILSDIPLIGFHFQSGDRAEPEQAGPYTGPHTTYYESGERDTTGWLENGRPEGAWSSLYEDGSKKSEGHYSDGETHLFWTYWYPNGRTRARGEYLYGKKEGEWREFHEDGTKSVVSEYRNGKEHGPYRSWYTNGNLRSEYRSAYGTKEGKSRAWHENGQLAAEGQYRNGRMHGHWSFWHADGTLDDMLSGRYENGGLVGN